MLEYVIIKSIYSLEIFYSVKSNKKNQPIEFFMKKVLWIFNFNIYNYLITSTFLIN